MGSSNSKTNVKLVFLDVDGVLNSLGSCRGGIEIQEDKLKLLKKIIDCIGAEIVISSSWRLVNHELKQLSDALKKYNMRYIGVTPKLFYRTDEIASFIKSYRKINKNIYISHWIAIDDINLSKWNAKMMKNHFVHTSLLRGLTEFHVEKAIKLLNT